MRTRTKALIGIGIAAAIGGIALAGASYAERGHGGMGFFRQRTVRTHGDGNNRFHRHRR